MKSLLATDRSLIENCILLLDWIPHDKDFDFEALKLLKFMAVLIRSEQRGMDPGAHGLCASATGHGLREFLDDVGVDLSKSSVSYESC